jgi:hypothetical protein
MNVPSYIPRICPLNGVNIFLFVHISNLFSVRNISVRNTLIIFCIRRAELTGGLRSWVRSDECPDQGSYFGSSTQRFALFPL